MTPKDIKIEIQSIEFVDNEKPDAKIEIKLSPKDQRKLRRWKKVNSILADIFLLSIFCIVIAFVLYYILAIFFFGIVAAVSISILGVREMNPPQTDASQLADSLVTDEERYWSNLYGAC